MCRLPVMGRSNFWEVCIMSQKVTQFETVMSAFPNPVIAVEETNRFWWESWPKFLCVLIATHKETTVCILKSEYKPLNHLTPEEVENEGLLEFDVHGDVIPLHKNFILLRRIVSLLLGEWVTDQCYIFVITFEKYGHQTQDVDLMYPGWMLVDTVDLVCVRLCLCYVSCFIPASSWGHCRG